MITRFKRGGMLVVLLVLSSLAATSALAQGKQHIIQLSGIVLSQEDSTGGLPGVHVYVPKAGRGTTTNRVGYFSMPVLEGDELVISCIGFVKQHYTVPQNEKQNVTIIVEMVSDTLFLDEVDIMPFPTEEVLKEALIAMNLPIQKNVSDENLNSELLALMLETTPMDASLNSRYYLNQWVEHQNDNFGPRPNPLLNPFNWAKFIKSLKKKNN